MADPNLTQIAASAWDAVVTDKPEDNIFGALKLAKAIQAGGGMIGKEGVNGGKSFEYTLEYAVNTGARSYGEFESLDTSRIDIFSAAQFQQKQHGAPVVFSDWEQLRTKGDNAKFDYVAGKLDNGKNSHLNDLNNVLCGDGSGNGGNDIDGVQKLIPTDPTTGIVGGVDPATWVFWRSQQASGTKTTSAGDNLRSSWTSVYDLCSRGGDTDAPTNVMTDRPSFELYMAQLSLYERYNKDGNGGKARGGNLGWDNNAIKFKNADVEYDEAAAKFVPGNAYFFNPKFLQFCYLTGAWMRLGPPQDLPTQFGNIYKILTIGQLCSGNRRRLGVVTAIN